MLSQEEQIENPTELKRRADIAADRMKAAFVVAVIVSVIATAGLILTKLHFYTNFGG